MSESKPPSNRNFPEPGLSTSDNTVAADRYADFLEALDLLYIKDNLSGRLLFLKEWPEAGQHIFGPELIEYDMKGAPDRARRQTLEAEAQQRRLQFIDWISDIERKCVHEGILQKQNVTTVVDAIGLHCARYVFSAHVLEKLYAPPPMPQTTTLSAAPAPVVETPVNPPPPAPEQAPEPIVIHHGPRVPVYKPETPAPVIDAPVNHPPAVTAQPSPEPLPVISLPPEIPVVEAPAPAAPRIVADPITVIAQASSPAPSAPSTPPPPVSPSQEAPVKPKPKIMGPPPRTKKPPAGS